jgi:hypothetical protein
MSPSVGQANRQLSPAVQYRAHDYADSECDHGTGERMLFDLAAAALAQLGHPLFQVFHRVCGAVFQRISAAFSDVSAQLREIPFEILRLG